MACNDRCRVVITGLGAVTPVGNDVESSWSAVCAGRSGITRISRFDPSDFGSQIAGEVKDFDVTAYVSKREAKRLDRFSEIAIAAGDQAVADSGLAFEETGDGGTKTPTDAPPERMGVIIGSGVGGLEEIETQMTRYLQKGARQVSPFIIPKMMANAPSGHVSIRYGLKGGNFCVVSACASGAHAIAEGYRTVRRGEADVMVVGGASAAITYLGLGGFSNMKALSRRNDEPERASRPFEKDRDGFVLAEGAGVLVLENLEFTRKRGARIYCELLGYGQTADAFHITEPARDGDGGSRCMRMAVEMSGRDPGQFSYVNAHGTSTPFNDKVETLALKRAFGDHASKLAVSSTKSMTGHMLGAAGAVEAVFTALTVHKGVVPPTINYETPDPDCDLDYVPNESREVDVDAALSNSLGFGGHNATLAFGNLAD